jgi:hypothetical protein
MTQIKRNVRDLRTAFILDMQTQPFLQEINYDRIFVDGSRHQIHLRTTISHATPITRERRPGFSKEGRITNGSQLVPSRCSGLMENVRPCPILTPPNNNPLICSRLRQEHTLVRRAFALSLSKTTESLVVFQFRNHPRYRSHMRYQPSLDGLFLF